MPTGQRSSTRAVRSAEIADRAEATRTALIDAAWRLFVARGYFATSTEEVVAAAGVGTRGALYHHFANKKALFLAVFDAVEEQVHSTAPDPAEHGGALAALRIGLRRYIRSSAHDEQRQILLIDGPAVLGWKHWREIQRTFGLGQISALLTQAMAESDIEDQPVEVLAHVLLAATDEAALYVANAPDPDAASQQAAAAIDRLLVGLQAPARLGGD